MGILPRAPIRARLRHLLANLPVSSRAFERGLYGVIFACGATAVLAVHTRHLDELEGLKRTYRAEQQAEADRQADRVEFTFRQFYQGLRTMSLLPGVRELDRQGANLDADERAAIQGIYNSTHENVTLSEVYLLPDELDPGIVDPATGEPEAPIMTFDELIVGKSSETASAHEDEGAELPEDESEEYEVYRAQLELLAALYPTEDTFPGLLVPAIWSHAIVTCDNSELTRDDLAAGNDEPRMGIALTLPRYDASGAFAGGVSGVVRSRVLTRALDAHDAALVAPGHGLAFSEAPSRELEEAEPFLARGDVDPRRIFSYRRVLAIPDQTPWELWVAKPDASFWGLPQVHQSRRYARLGEAALLAFTLALALSARSSLRRGAVLRRKVAEQTRELGERNEQLALILDNTDQGFVVLDKRLRAASQGSAAFRAWFGEIQLGQDAAELLMPGPRQRLELRLNFEQLVEDFMPFELCVEQMPRHLRRDLRTYELDYRPIRDGETLTHVLLVISDVTAKIQGELAEEQNRELTTVLGHLMRDRRNFMAFLEETNTLLADAASTSDKTFFRRLVHTAKGNTALYGFRTFAQRCHELEDYLDAVGEIPPDPQLQAWLAMWRSDMDRVRDFISVGERISIGPEDYDALLAQIRDGVSHDHLLLAFAAMKLEPLANRLRLLGERGAVVAERLGKPVRVRVEDGGVRLPHESLGRVFASLAHVVRNAVDHGLEAREVRVAAGKPPEGCLSLGGSLDHDELVITVSDDGAGIDWTRVAAKAAALRLPSTTREDLVRALFVDGISTRDEVSETSGRGVGLGAVLSACEQIGGRVEIATEEGRGTRWIVRLPCRAIPGLQAPRFEQAA